MSPSHAPPLPPFNGGPRRRHVPWWVARRVWLWPFGLGVCAVRYAPSGYALAGLACPWYHRPRVGDVCLGEEVAELMLKRSDVVVPMQGQVRQAVDTVTPERWPVLYHYLTQTTWDDGSPRELASLLVFVDAGTWKAMCKDKDSGRCLWVAAPTFSALWDVMEAALGDPHADWRADKMASGASSHKKRKAG